jgi:exodeoxyribonuclease V alpha subunit
MTLPAAATAAGHGPETEALAGLVERVTFHNADSGFCVLRVKVRRQRDLVTVVGHAATIAVGEWMQMSGTWINDRTHGLQFRAAFLKASLPTTLEGIEKYLGSGMIRGIGPVYATSWSKPLARGCSTSSSRNRPGFTRSRASAPRGPPASSPAGPTRR